MDKAYKANIGDIMGLAQILKMANPRGLKTVTLFTQLINRLNDPTKAFFDERTKKHKEMLDASNQVDDKGEKMLSAEQEAQFQTDVQELMDTEVEFHFFDLIKLDLNSAKDSDRFSMDVSGSLLQVFGSNLQISIDGEIQTFAEETASVAAEPVAETGEKGKPVAGEPIA